MRSPARFIGVAWLVLLGLALLSSAAGCYSRARHIGDRAWGCDAFGYLSMARQVRLAPTPWAADYSIETPRVRELIEHLKAHGVPPGAWDQLVAPHAYHYFPEADRVGPQYPPGTGLALALFPEGAAVRRLGLVTIMLFVVVGLIALVAAYRTRAYAAAGGFVFALQLGLRILPEMGVHSYSLIAMLVPMLAAVILLCAAAAVRQMTGRCWAAAGLALVAGVCFGLAVLVRLPVLFLLPGLTLLTLGRTWRTFVNTSTIAFGLGAILGGALPLAHHQQQVAGAWHLSTYGPGDAAPPSLKPLGDNLEFYSEDGTGGRYNRDLIVSAIAFLGIALLARATGRSPGPLGPGRLLLAAAVTWAVPTAYFLTHSISIIYYMAPGILGAVLILGLGGFTLQARRPTDAGGEQPASRRVRILAVAVTLLTGGAVIQSAYRTWPDRPLTDEQANPQIGYPAELSDERAWIFADHQSGSVWYYAGQPGFKTPFASPQLRAMVYRFVFARGEPMYLIDDNEGMKGLVEEVRKAGGVLEKRGMVDWAPYYLVRWPATGPTG